MEGDPLFEMIGIAADGFDGNKNFMGAVFRDWGSLCIDRTE